MTTRQTIADWLLQGQRQKFKYCIIVTDRIDWTDYPVFSHTEKDMREKVFAFDNMGRLTKVIEVYDLNESLHAQLCSYRCRADLNTKVERR